MTRLTDSIRRQIINAALDAAMAKREEERRNIATGEEWVEM